jgi:hypothetical protein
MFTFFTKVVTRMVEFLPCSRSGDTRIACDDVVEQQWALNEG